MRDRLVNYLRGAGAPTAIGGIWLEMFNGDPQAGGASIQAAVTGSANRLDVKAALGASANGVSTNAAVVQLVAAAAAGGTFTHGAFYDAQTAGNLIGSHALTGGNIVITAGNAVQVNAGGLTLTIA
jgi:hypothetical protein